MFFVRSLFERLSFALKRQKGILLGLLLLPLCLLPLPEAGLEAAFLDVDQGDGIVLREQGGAVLLVDGGSTGVQNVGEKRIIPYLKSQGIRVIDCAFVSHTDSDHMNGVKEILEAMPVYSEYRESVAGYTGTPVIKRIVLPEWYGAAVETLTRNTASGLSEGQERVTSLEWNVNSGLSEGQERIASLEWNVNSGLSEGQERATSLESAENVEYDQAYLALVELAKEKQVEVYYMTAGNSMKVGKELKLTCLAPEEGVTYEDKNAASMVLLATYGEFDLLLTGDMDREGEARLLEEGLFSPEVLKVAHHGSYTASSEEFITALSPQIAVISCGKNNRYGHPHKETLEALNKANCVVYRTDESGCVTVRVKQDGKIKVKKWRNPD